MADPIGLKMTPDLAERWESASDGSSMTFHLRGNALWHDGTPLTSEDVAWTYHMYLNGETGSKRTGVLALIAGGEEYTKGEADSVTGIVAVDDRTIRFEQAFPNILFLAQTTYPILPKHLLGDTLPIDLAQNKFFFDEPLGSGPFKFVSYIPDQRIELEANDDYYFGRPKIDREIISVIKSPDAVQIALQRGEIHLPIFDGGENASTEQFQAFIQDPRFTVSASKGTTLISYAFNSRREDLVNDKMRQAFLHALDRQRLVDTFAQGNGSIFNSFLVHGWYQLPDWSEKYPYDPDKARQLIAESGWDTNREIGCTIIAVSSEEARAMLAAEQQMLAEVGIKIKFHEVELALWVETFYETYEWDTIRVTFGVFPDPDGFLSFHMRSGSRNAMGYANPTLDEKIDRGKRSIDQAERASIYQEINEEMITTLPLAPVHLLNQWWILDKKFSIPFFDALPEATSFATVPIGPAFLGHSDWQKFHIEQWDLK
jgi:ABC-type transport system substrate-binding protein